VAVELTVARNKSGKLELFVLAGGTTVGSVFHIWQTAPNAGWGNWKELAWAGELNRGISNIASTAHEDGRLAVFLDGAHGGSAGIVHKFQTGANGNWDNWSAGEGSPAEFGGFSADPMAVGRGLGGRIQVFVHSARNFFWRRWQLDKNAGFSDFYLVVPPGAPSDYQDLLLANNQDGHLELFTIGGDGVVYHMWETAPAAWSYVWSAFAEPQPGERVIPAERALLGAALNGDGLLSLFYRGPGGPVGNPGSTVWRIEQLAANANWGDWVFMGGSDTLIGPSAVGTNAQGRLELFVSSDNSIWHQWQESVNSTTVWQPWDLRASWFDRIRAALMG